MKQVVYHPVPLETKEVAVQRLVLIVPVEEQMHDKQAAIRSTFLSLPIEIGNV